MGRSADNSSNRFESPLSSSASPVALLIQDRRNSPQRVPSMPQLPNGYQGGLFAWVWFQMLPVPCQPVSVREVADALPIGTLVAHCIAFALADGLPFPLADRDHNIDYEPPSRRAGVQRLCYRDERYATALESFEHLPQILHASGEPVELRNDHCVDVTGIGHCEQP